MSLEESPDRLLLVMIRSLSLDGGDPELKADILEHLLGRYPVLEFKNINVCQFKKENCPAEERIHPGVTTPLSLTGTVLVGNRPSWLIISGLSIHSIEPES